MVETICFLESWKKHTAQKANRLLKGRGTFWMSAQRHEALQCPRISSGIQQAHQEERFATVDVWLPVSEEVEDGRLVVDENVRHIDLKVTRGFFRREAGGEGSVGLGKDIDHTGAPAGEFDQQLREFRRATPHQS